MKNVLRIMLLIAVITGNNQLVSAQPYQPFPTDSAEWIGGCAVFEIPFLPFHYVIDGDTIMGNKQYSKIYSMSGSGSFVQKELYCGMRTDSVSKVWVKYLNNMGYGWMNVIDTTDLLIYNFSLGINDTFYVKNAVGGDTTGYYYKLIHADSVQLLDASKRKRFHFLILSPTVFGNNYEVWIEGIGSLWHPFYNSVNSPWPYDTTCNTFGTVCNGLYCFYEGLEKVFGYDTCYPTNSIKNNTMKKECNYVKPNPFTDVATIDVSEIPDAVLVIMYDSKGLVVRKTAIQTNQKQIYIYREGFSKGLYLLEIRSKAKPSIFEKVIIY